MTALALCDTQPAAHQRAGPSDLASKEHLSYNKFPIAGHHREVCIRRSVATMLWRRPDRSLLPEHGLGSRRARRRRAGEQLDSKKDQPSQERAASG
jgi:hypothetical protein